MTTGTNHRLVGRDGPLCQCAAAVHPGTVRSLLLCLGWQCRDGAGRHWYGPGLETGGCYQLHGGVTGPEPSPTLIETLREASPEAADAGRR